MKARMSLEHRGEYPPNWTEIARAVKAAADNRCIRCGHPSESVVARAICDDRCTHDRDGKLRVLTVHHMDGDKANCRWWNLLALCQVCHLQIQAKIVPERPWLYEHSAWFRVYAAGFYAFYHEQHEIARAEAERNLERWLALGQPWLYAGGAA